MRALSEQSLDVIRGLPPALAIQLWSEQQSAHLQNERIFWGYVSYYLDFRQQQTLGFRPENPADREPNPLLREKIETYGDFFLAQFNLINSAWDDWIAPHSHHRDPRSFFVELVTMLAQQSFEPCLQPVSDGLNNRDLIQLQRDLSGFYRGRLKPSEEAQILRWLKNSKDYFWLSLIWNDRNRGKLKRCWCDFEQAHRRLQRFFDKTKASVPSWHNGLPVGARGEQRLYKT